MFKGHPRGLAPLFFTEMWERLGFYLIVGILVLYASDAERGGLGLTRERAAGIYGTYLAFVYFTPFLGGLLADRILGYRRAVLIGGLFFAAGFFLLGIPGMAPFYGGLVALCVGNGFFKPNISAMVGNLYERGDPKRDTGFNIFYMGINIGAAGANLMAAPIRNQMGWRWTFWAAAIGICIGLAVLLTNWRVLEKADRKPERSPDDVSFGEIFGKILLPAAVFGAAGYFLANAFPAVTALVPANMCGFLLGMVPILFFYVRVAVKAPEPERPGLTALLPVFVAGGTFFMILHLNGSAMTVWADEKTDRQVSWVPDALQMEQDALPSYYVNAASDVVRPDESTLVVVDKLTAKMFGVKKMPESGFARAIADLKLNARTLWSGRGAAVDAAASLGPESLSVYVLPDDQVLVDTSDPDRPKVALDAGATPTSKVLFVATDARGESHPVVLVDAETKAKVYANAGPERLLPGQFLQVVNPEIYQSWNPIFVVVLTPFVVGFFALLLRRGKRVSTARKLFYGMLLTAGAMCIMVGAGLASENGSSKVAGLWLVATYFVLTIGELCLSPMGLSLVTKLSPKRLVGVMMGGWFLATAFGNKLSGFLGQLQQKLEPAPFFSVLVVAALAVAFLLYLLLPKMDATLEKYGA